jgi:dienelactone hydrolase
LVRLILLLSLALPLHAATPAALRAQIRAALRVPTALPALELETYGDLRLTPDVVIERVSYATGYGLRVPAIVYRPAIKPAGRMPGLIVVNGHGGDKYSWYAFYAGILYARAGAVVVTYDPIGEGERNAEKQSGTRQHDKAIDPPEMGRHMGGLMMTDVLQATTYLAQRPDVDPKRLAAMGYSMGSFVLGLACAVETRLHACVLSGGGNLDGEGGYWDTSSKTMCQAIPYQSMKFLGDRGAVLYDLHARRGGTLILNGTDDDVVSMTKMGATFFDDLRKRTIALHGGAENVFDVDWVQGGGHRPYFVTRAAALWLEQRLEFPRWSAEKIARMPETHISEWAAANSVFIDRTYATELREGGAMALGDGLPPVARELLNALPAERWDQDRDRYIYESWVKRALKLLP